MDTEQNIPHIEEAEYFAALLLKQLRQEITDDELQVLENWKASHPSFARVCEQVNDGEQLLADLVALKQIDMDGWWQKISEQIEPVKKPVPLYRRWYTYAAAAVLLLAAATITWRYLVPNTSPKVVNEQQAPGVVNVQPGGNRATLTLSDGAVINLTNAGNGKLAQEGDMRVVKLKDGEVKYESAGNPQSTIIKYNTLSTPRGGQYSVLLPDGSQVWLNAASSIKYPTQFAANERRVTITGEVYFEVVRGGAKKVPFIVTVQSQAGKNMQDVEVVGTRFNIMAYDDEAAIKTTLLNGKVKVSVPEATPGKKDDYRLLTPGQQAQVPHAAGNTIKVIDMADEEDVIGWKKGLVSFKDADIPSIMRLLSRWYNVDISYQGNIPAYTFTGTLPLKNNLSVVMQVLEYAGVHLNLQQNQNKIIVKP
jgi:ferric-dicitrate binding protein FerR (iron transport regulator)